ncbi:hypothetical protein NE237_024029 [Protea cynaroides]|uniref:Uncharacterized protein n=1 Tax=Protea cynaroides TaxID=273540 RepID=A0A9Q0HG64_9MAGN|nr:hypothetical protein NE237_024029 [Protea cynaroides]
MDRISASGCTSTFCIFSRENYFSKESFVDESFPDEKNLSFDGVAAKVKAGKRRFALQVGGEEIASIEETQSSQDLKFFWGRNGKRKASEVAENNRRLRKAKP